MKMRKRWSTFLLVLIMMLAVLPFPVSANSPMPMPWYDFILSNLPAGTEYVDLLILLPESDPMYTELNEEHIPDEFREDAQIIDFCENDFRSYTFHHMDALSVIYIDSHASVHFFADKDYDLVRYEHTDRIYRNGTVRLAMLDAYGNILKVSPELILRPREFMTYVTGTFYYDGLTDEFRVDTAGAGFGRILYFFLCLFGMTITCLIERLVAIPFKLGKNYGHLIIRTNILSQILMYAGYAVFYSLIFWKYVYATIILEILVYLGEYLVYRREMEKVPQKISFAYSMAANTASLTLGLLIYRTLLY